MNRLCRPHDLCELRHHPVEVEVTPHLIACPHLPLHMVVKLPDLTLLTLLRAETPASVHRYLSSRLNHWPTIEHLRKPVQRRSGTKGHRSAAICMDQLPLLKSRLNQFANPVKLRRHIFETRALQPPFVS